MLENTQKGEKVEGEMKVGKARQQSEEYYKHAVESIHFRGRILCYTTSLHKVEGLLSKSF